MLCNVAICLSEIQIIGIQIYWKNDKLSENISGEPAIAVYSNEQQCTQNFFWGDDLPNPRCKPVANLLLLIWLHLSLELTPTWTESTASFPERLRLSNDMPSGAT